MRSALPVLVLFLGAEGPLAAQAADDFPPLTRDFAAAEILEAIGCPVDILVLSVEADDPDEKPASRTVLFRIPGSGSTDLEVRFDWEWQLTDDLESEWDDPPGRWRVASVASGTRPLEGEEARKARRAMDEMRTIATAVEAFAVDHELYPPSGAGLWKRVVPIYIRRFPPKDPWGNAYRYETGPKRDHYILSSSGGEEFSRLPETFFREVAATGAIPAVPVGVAGPTEIVYSDGTFLLGPLQDEASGSSFLPGFQPCVPGDGGKVATVEPGVE